MAKAYWVSCYRSISNPDAVAAYAKLAGPALAAAGGRFLARGIPAQTYEAGVKQRMVGPGQYVKVQTAVMVVVPVARLVARPELLIVAMPVLEELQITEVVMFWLLPSVYVPVAAN